MKSDSLSISSGAHARIFLLSHMRAYTSLVGHILGSHPQINGYYEMHISYEEPAALDRQREGFEVHNQTPRLAAAMGGVNDKLGQGLFL